MKRTYICGEIGISHNGSIDIALEMIRKCKDAGCDAVKFQKRTIDLVYTPEELAKPRESPFGTTNGDLKRGLEFGQSDYEQIDIECSGLGIDWFASCWDVESVDFISQFQPKYWKIASASITDTKLLSKHLEMDDPKFILSTGMSTEGEIQTAINTLGKDNIEWLVHCTSTYPTATEEINLSYITKIKEKFGITPGFSNHHPGIIFCVTAPVLGAQYLEFHVTLGRAMWGSDQAASIEFPGVERIVKYVRALETAWGDGEKVVYPSEVPIKEKLRRV